MGHPLLRASKLLNKRGGDFSEVDQRSSCTSPRWASAALERARLYRQGG